MRAWFEGRKPLGISIDGCVLSRAARDRRAHDGILAHIPRRHDRGADRYRGRAIAVAERSPEEAVLGRRSRDDETSFYIDVGPGTYVFSSGLRLPPRAIALSHVYIKRLFISEPIKIWIRRVLNRFPSKRFTYNVSTYLSLNEQTFVNSRRTLSNLIHNR